MIIKTFDCLIRFLQALKRFYLQARLQVKRAMPSSSSRENINLNLYASTDYSNVILDEWGKDSVWKEIKFFITFCHGRILDIACGTGEVIHQLKAISPHEIHGCDIVPRLIERAKEKGIEPSRLQVCDASHLPYHNEYFDFAYSIGTLHVMPEEKILAALKESHRVTKKAFFFQVPTTRKAVDEGWIQMNQHYFNNTIDWWRKKCASVYKEVHVLDSTWEDLISVGKWFVCWK